jgi:hypothetical protein
MKLENFQLGSKHRFILDELGTQLVGTDVWTLKRAAPRITVQPRTFSHFSTQKLNVITNIRYARMWLAYSNNIINNIGKLTPV